MGEANRNSHLRAVLDIASTEELIGALNRRAAWLVCGMYDVGEEGKRESKRFHHVDGDALVVLGALDAMVECQRTLCASPLVNMEIAKQQALMKQSEEAKALKLANC